MIDTSYMKNVTKIDWWNLSILSMLLNSFGLIFCKNLYTMLKVMVDN